MVCLGVKGSRCKIGLVTFKIESGEGWVECVLFLHLPTALSYHYPFQRLKYRDTYLAGHDNVQPQTKSPLVGAVLLAFWSPRCWPRISDSRKDNEVWTRILTTVSLGRMGLSLIPLSYYSVGHCCYALAGIWAWSGLDFREGNKAQILMGRDNCNGMCFS